MASAISPRHSHVHRVPVRDAILGGDGEEAAVDAVGHGRERALALEHGVEEGGVHLVEAEVIAPALARRRFDVVDDGFLLPEAAPPLENVHG